MGVGGAAGLEAGTSVVGTGYGLEFGNSLTLGMQETFGITPLVVITYIGFVGVGPFFAGAIGAGGGFVLYSIARKGINHLGDDFRRAKRIHKELNPIIEKGKRAYKCYKELEKIYHRVKGIPIKVDSGNYEGVLDELI